LGPRLAAPEIAREIVGNTGTGQRTATNAPYSIAGQSTVSRTSGSLCLAVTAAET
jgi:hypothetical protein